MDFVDIHRDAETRECEFKRGVSWEENKRRVTKTVLAMSNLEDGGRVIIGVQKNSDTGPYEAVGMAEAIAATYDHDAIMAFANNYADPQVKILVQKFQHNSDWFVSIRVFGFDEIPVICQRTYQDGPDTVLREGRIYARLKRMPESSENLKPEDLREILQVAVRKGLGRQIETMRRAGLLELVVPGETTAPADEARFREERGGF